jgi:hypothetical protein
MRTRVAAQTQISQRTASAAFCVRRRAKRRQASLDLSVAATCFPFGHGADFKSACPVNEWVARKVSKAEACCIHANQNSQLDQVPPHLCVALNFRAPHK